MTLLVVTNDFPPREGGIQTFVRSLLDHVPPEDVVVFASTSPGWPEYDAATPFRVVRHPTTMLLPTPSVRGAAVDLARSVGADRAWFGAAAPLGLLAPALRAAGVRRLVGSTHGHETGWAAVPGGRQLLHRIGVGLDAVTYITDYTLSRLRPALAGTAELRRVAPGVDVEVFRPDVDGSVVRRTHGLEGRRVIGCVSRLVPRKGQDVLIAAMPAIRARVPDATLFLVGHGRDLSRLHSLIRRHDVADCVVLSGAVPHAALPAHYAACDVFAMPCRTRRGGLDVEGLGIVYLEAAATGLAVVAGSSGGAPEAVRTGPAGTETGVVLADPRDPGLVARTLVELLLDDERRVAMGRSGRAWVEQEWTWAVQAARLRALLDG